MATEYEDIEKYHLNNALFTSFAFHSF